MIKRKINKHGQIAVFVILGLIIITSIILLLFLRKGPELIVPDEENPEAFIESCTKEAIDEAINLLSEQGGDIEAKGGFLYNGKNIDYLCYNKNYYEPCINQKPLLKEHIRKEIESYITPKVEACFQTLKKELEKTNSIEMREMELKIVLEPKRAVAEIKRYFKISKNGNIKELENFKASVIDPVYELAGIASEIANQEAKFCYFEYVGYQLLYPEFEINKKEIDGEIKVYEVVEKKSGRKFVFAIRSCAMPAGM